MSPDTAKRGWTVPSYPGRYFIYHPTLPHGQPRAVRSSTDGQHAPEIESNEATRAVPLAPSPSRRPAALPRRPPASSRALRARAPCSIFSMQIRLNTSQLVSTLPPWPIGRMLPPWRAGAAHHASGTLQKPLLQWSILSKGKLKWRKESGLHYSSRCTRHTFKFHTLVNIRNQKCSVQHIKQTVS